MSFLHYWRAMWGIIGRELWRFIKQRERFISAFTNEISKKTSWSLARWSTQNRSERKLIKGLSEAEQCKASG